MATSAGAAVGAAAVLAARARAGHGRLAAHEVLVCDELVAVLLHHQARELPPADDEHFLVVLLQLLDERDEIAVAADDDERVDVVVRKRHLERVEREIDVGAVLVPARREVPLHHADGVLRHHPAVIAGPLPVAVGDLGHDFAPFLDAVQNRRDVELRMQRGLHTDFDVVEIDEDRNLQSLIDQIVFSLRTLTFCPRIFVAFSAAIIRSASASGTSTNENLSAISIAPSERDGTSASPVIAPTRSPGRMPAARPAPMNSRTLLPSPFAGLLCGRSRGLSPGAPRHPPRLARRRRRGRRRNLALLVPTERVVRHLHRRRGDVDRIELVRQRFHHDPHVVEIGGDEPLAK